MKYDDASWHSGGNFPKDLPPAAGATHTGMYMAWALLSGLGGEIHVTELPDEILKLRSRSVTPRKFFLHACDGKFTDEDLNEEGNLFTQAYFDFDKGNFLNDYEAILAGDLESLYYVQDTWDNFDLLKPRLDQRLAEWKSKR
jgi:hypothetical protein